MWYTQAIEPTGRREPQWQTSTSLSLIHIFIVFSMVVPFQMVMFTLSKTADQLKLNTP